MDGARQTGRGTAQRTRSRPRRRLLAGLAVLALTAVLALSASARDGTGPVDLALVLAVDCSYSVDGREYALQMNGIAAALDHPAVRGAIKAGPRGRVAFAVVQWSGENSQEIVVPFTAVGTDAEIDALAARIRATPRVAAEGSTSITAMIDFARLMLTNLSFEADRRVLDLVADGINNIGGWTRPARDRALAAGLTINGLAIQNEVSYLRHWFRNHVIGGENAFVLDIDGYDDFPAAIRVKLIREIRPELI